MILPPHFRHLGRYLIGLLCIIALIAYFGEGITFMVVMLGLILVGGFSTFYYNYFHGPLNIELIKFGAVIAAFEYGFWPSVIVGVSSTLLSRIWSGRFDHRTLVSVAGMLLISALSLQL